MAVIRTKAEYQEKSEIMEYVGNPLISALPKNLEKKRPHQSTGKDSHLL